MSPLFPALRQALETKALTFHLGSRYGAQTRVSSYGVPNAAAGWDLTTAVEEAYEREVWVYKAIEIISGNASRLPFQITVGDDAIEKHALLRMMNKRANPLEIGRAFRKRLSAQVLLNKTGAFVEVTHTNGGQINRLDLLDPSRVRIVPDAGGDYVDYFEYTRYDGEVRNLAPNKVRWIREPHPLDPFSGVTPLEAAGVSIELDQLARRYNSNFIKRDGRPGGIVGVDVEGLDEKELDRISALFGGGAEVAGAIRAIGVGKGGMNYVDTSAKPRDMAYETTSEKAKKEILAAFGVPESIAGDASDRTFDNASEEKFTFWNEVMLPHLDLVASAFDGDVDEDADCGYDLSEVEVLELPARRRRTEAREEFDKGLRTVKEYRALQPELEIIDNAQTRALWMSPAKAPVPGRPEDAAELGLAGDAGAMPGMPGDPMAPGAGGGPGDPMGPGGAPAGESAADAVARALAEGGVVAEEASGPLVVGEAAAAVDAARAASQSEPLEGPASAAVDAARLEGKAIEPGFVILPEVVGSYEPGEDEIIAVARGVQVALEAMLARQAGVVAARLESPRFRRGTPFWVPSGDDDTRAGTATIDSAAVLDAPRWVAEAQETLMPLTSTAARDAAEGLLSQMATTGALLGAQALSAVVAGRAAAAPVATAEEIARFAATATVSPIMLALATAGDALTTWLEDRAGDLDEMIVEQGSTPDLPLLVDQVKRTWERESAPLAKSLAVTIAQTALAGGRDAVVEQLAPEQPRRESSGQGWITLPPEVARTWCCREDERVREAHAKAAGQTVGVGELFEVGGHDMRYPSDPLAPPSVSRFCRCWIRYEWTEGARFRLPLEALAAA